MSVPQVPRDGQVVNVRGSTWAVTEVREQGLPRSPADEGIPGLTHVVGLQSLEEDRLGEELQVVWELEAGHTVAPDQGLPDTIDVDGFDDPNTLAAFVDAVRWGAVTSADADSYQAPFRSGANVEAYQLEPLRRALQSSRTNLLLADDVGLGKTIEAGLVIQELLLRHRARSVIVVCPPSLMLKWQDEMREKFGLEFTIVNSELLANVRRVHGLNANPLRLYPRVIVSMAWLPSLRAQRLLRDVYADADDTRTARRFAFDLLVVDEAHHVAPSSPTANGRRGYAVDSQRTLATRALAEKTEHRLFLSATPHNGYSESFTALLEMIDGRRFKRGAILDEHALREVAVRRLKSELTDKDFKARRLNKILFTPSDDEQSRFAELDRILIAGARSGGKRSAAELAGMLLKKRFLSSPWSFARTLELYQDAAAGGSAMLDDDAAYYQEVLGSGQSDEEEGETDQPEFTALRHTKAADPLVAASPEEIGALIEWGYRYQSRPDSRLKALTDWLDGICRPDGKHWTNERVVIFTEYTATLQWIAGVLEQRGYGPVLETIQGSTPGDERERIRSDFTKNPANRPVRVLLATDAAGEGIDLQDYCHRLVNYDIPFNPSRLEQRIGRIDRYGQTLTPEIFNFSPVSFSTTYGADLGFLERIAQKVGEVVKDLGSANQVIDAELQDHFIPRQGKSRAARAVPDDGNAIIGRVLAGERTLSRRLTELSRTYRDRKQQMHLTPGNARRVVDTALELTQQPPLKEIGDDRTDADVFEVQPLGQSWQSALEGLEDRTGEQRPITFDDEAAKVRDEPRLVNVHLGHAILQRAARVLRSKLFSVDSPVKRVTAVEVAGLDQPCVAAVSRLVLVGRGGVRLHEEVFLTGIRVGAQDLAEARTEDLLDRALDERNLRLAGVAARTEFAGLWAGDDSRLRNRLQAAMRRKADIRQERVTEQLETRRADDVARAQEIFAAFRLNLINSRDLLAEEIRGQEELLFSDEQQRQRQLDLRAMQDRLASLADEERREIDAINDRYTDIKPYVSAAAVVFAVPAEGRA